MKTSNKIWVAFLIPIILLSVVSLAINVRTYKKGLPYASAFYKTLPETQIRAVDLRGDTKYQFFANDMIKRIYFDEMPSAGQVYMAGDTLVVINIQGRIALHQTDEPVVLRNGTAE